MSILKNLSTYFQQPNRYDGYSFSKREHYQNILNPKDIIDLVNKYMKLHDNRYPTDVGISFGGVSFGTTLTNFLASNNKPRYKIENNYNQVVNHSILFYKEKLGKHKAISQFHFVDDLFLWGMYLFNNYLQVSELKEVEKVLTQKYKISEALNLKDIIITDKEKNMIQLRNEVYTSIHYMTGNKPLIEKLRKEVGDYQGLIRIPTGEEQRNLFDKL
jgi:hypothetical protein